MDNRAIGVFDSGLGGLTAVHTLQRLLPREHLIYFGDTARLPYGSRTREILLEYTRQDMHFLQSFQPKVILAACGTVSTTALPAVQQESTVPVFGVVEPTCRRAGEVTENRRIGVIATQASIRSGAYQTQLQALVPGATVLARACPLLVPLVEAGRIQKGDIVIETVVREYLEPLKEEGIDTLILGCTHYPLLTDIIQALMGDTVTLVSAGEEAAFALKRFLKQQDLLSDRSPADGQPEPPEFYVSDREEDFQRIASLFLQEELQHGATRVDITRY